MKTTIYLFTFIASIVFSTQSMAQSQQCDWWGRINYPICENKDTGWGNENGQKCISADTCVSDQPSDRGGIIGGSSNSDDGSSSGSNPVVSTGDQCNTTLQCQSVFGSQATDCLNSKTETSVCMCGSARCDNEPDDDGGNSNNSDFPQPPSNCSNINNNIPDDILLHNIYSSVIPRSNFSSTAQWYTEDGNVQRFQLHEGDQNQRTSILRPRIEAFAPPPRWNRNSGWHEFSANYYLAEWDEAQRYALFQIKTNDASNFIIQVLVDDDRSLEIARRSRGTVKIADDIYQEPFNLRVRSNGFQFEVYLNCELVLAEDHPQPNLEDSNTQYTWRWGLYRQEADDDRHDGTTTMYVTGPTFD